MATSKIKREAQAAAEYLKNGIHRRNSWVRVCLIYKGSYNAKGIARLVDALSIHFPDVGFASSDIGTHFEIACSDGDTAKLAYEYVNGGLAK